MPHINTIDCLPVDQRVYQGINVAVFKYVNKVCPYYTREVFGHASQDGISLRNNFARI